MLLLRALAYHGEFPDNVLEEGWVDLRLHHTVLEVVHHHGTSHVLLEKQPVERNIK